jgi:serine/threonine protein kinase
MAATANRPHVTAVVDSLCDRFEDALRAGERPVLDAWLREAGSDASAALADLVDLDLDHRIRTGESITAADYFARFPELLADPTIAVRLVSTEFQAARARQPGVSEADFRYRYPNLANHPEWSNGPWVSKSASERTSSFASPADTTDEFRPGKTDAAEFLATFLATPERPGDIGRLAEYHICGVLGAGGMGVVLEAEDPTLLRTVAIKLMRPEVATRPGARERFLREARSVAAVAHPRVVVIHHIGEWKGTPFLVMPLMAGRSLQNRLKADPPMPLDEIVRIVREAADGLAAAHARGLTHRDIKPDNLWLEDTTEGSHVRLLDFGLARGDEAESLTVPGAVMGTPSYMAPEQASGQSVDGRTDLFSLGCVLFELLTGQKAFAGSTVLSVLHALANHHPPEVRALVPTIPASLSDLTKQLLEKSPEHRPTSAIAVSAELRRIEATLGAPPNLAPIAPPQRTPTQRRQPRWVWVTAAVVLLAVAALVSWVVARDRTPIADIPESSRVDLNALPSKPEPAPPLPPIASVPLRVTKFNVNHYTHMPDADVLRGVLGEKTFSPALNDRVRVAVQLSKPGYAYVIALRPDGVVDLCFPADEEMPPPLTDTPRYPSPPADPDDSYGLKEGEGLWVFAVVASEKPLPSYRTWLSQHFRNKIAWTPMPKIPPDIVWRDDGNSNVETLTPSGMVLSPRGKSEKLIGPATTITHLTDSLRITGQMDTVSAIGFRVGKREKD